MLVFWGRYDLSFFGIGLAAEQNGHLADGADALASQTPLHRRCYRFPFLPLCEDLNLDQLVGLQRRVDGSHDRIRQALFADLNQGPTAVCQTLSGTSSVSL